MNDSSLATLVIASRPVRYAAAVALGMLALFLLVQTFNTLDHFGERENAPVNTITVSGTGKSTTVPDIANVTFTVEETATSVKDAQDKATKRTNDALAAVKALGISDKDVQTADYQVNPQYQGTPSCPPNAPCAAIVSAKIAGYQVSQTVTIKIRDTANVGAVLEKLGTLGVQNISGPSFASEDETGVLDESRGKAIDDAREKAKVLAKQLHVRLGSVVNYSENGSPILYSKGLATDARAEVAPAAAPSIPVGQNESTVNVTITYEIR